MNHSTLPSPHRVYGVAGNADHEQLIMDRVAVSIMAVTLASDGCKD